MEEVSVRKKRRRSLRVRRGSISTDLIELPLADIDKENGTEEDGHLGSAWMDVSPQKSVSLPRKNRRRSKHFVFDNLWVNDNEQNIEISRSPDKKISDQVPVSQYGTPNLTPSEMVETPCEPFTAFGNKSLETDAEKCGTKDVNISDMVPYSPSQSVWDNISPLPVGDMVNTPVSPVADLVFYTPVTDKKHFKDRHDTEKPSSTIRRKTRTSNEKKLRDISGASALMPKQLACQYKSGATSTSDRNNMAVGGFTASHNSRAEEFLSMCKSLAGRLTSLVKVSSESTGENQTAGVNENDCSEMMQLDEGEDNRYVSRQVEWKCESINEEIKNVSENMITKMDVTDNAVLEECVDKITQGNKDVHSLQEDSMQSESSMQSENSTQTMQGFSETNVNTVGSSDAGNGSSVANDTNKEIRPDDSENIQTGIDMTRIKQVICENDVRQEEQEVETLSCEKMNSPEKKNSLSFVTNSVNDEITPLCLNDSDNGTSILSAMTEKINQVVSFERKSRARKQKQKRADTESTQPQQLVSKGDNLVSENLTAAVLSPETSRPALSKMDLDSLDEYLTTQESRPEVKKEKGKRGRPRRKSADFSIIQGGQDQIDSGCDAPVDCTIPSRRSSRLKRRSLELYKMSEESSAPSIIPYKTSKIDLSETDESESMAQADQRVNMLCEDVPCDIDMEFKSESSIVAMDTDRTNEPSAKVKVPRKRKQKETEEEIERLYRNKNFEKPSEGVWETIFESPKQSKNPEQTMSKRRYKRSISFDGYYFVHVPPVKQKKRIQKAIKQGWDPKKRRLRSMSDTEALEKLENLDIVLGQNTEV